MDTSSYGSSRVAVQRAGWLAVLVAGWVLALCGGGWAAEQTGSAAAPVKIAVLGDSLTAGFGLPLEATFPVRLAQALKAKGLAVEVIDAGVSGDTASGGRDRLDWSVPEGTEAVIVELGANDALRGLDPAVTRAALEAILVRLKARNISVLLCGMLAPRNLGPDYGARFDAIYLELAQRFGVALYPFFLEGVAADSVLNQRDGLHPTAAGVEAIVARILPRAEDLVAEALRRRG
ncbi:MAG: arylesterase [Xanthobacteraceae bacterium]|nr:MAG: arylesterase [Xanthobacteraceae bacterium]